MALFRTRIPTDVAVDFTTRHFAPQVSALHARPELQEFVRLIGDQETHVAAMREYRRVTGAGRNEAYLALQVFRAAVPER